MFMRSICGREFPYTKPGLSPNESFIFPYLNSGSSVFLQDCNINSYRKRWNPL